MPKGRGRVDNVIVWNREVRVVEEVEEVGFKPEVRAFSKFESLLYAKVSVKVARTIQSVAFHLSDRLSFAPLTIIHIRGARECRSSQLPEIGWIEIALPRLMAVDDGIRNLAGTDVIGPVGEFAILVAVHCAVED